MISPMEARAQMRNLALEAEQLVQSKSLTTAQKTARFDQIDADMAECKQAIEVSARSAHLMSGSSSLGSGEGSNFAASLKTGRVPRLNLDEDTVRALYGAISSKQSLRIETKATTTDVGTLVPSLLMLPPIDLRYEPVRLLDYIGAAPMAGPSVELIQHVSTTGVATTVARGAAKPVLVFNTQPLILTARKIAAVLTIPDETLQDIDTWAAYCQTELTRAVTDAENGQVLSGDGVGEDLLGLLNVAGILTRNYTTDVAADANATGLDSIEMSIADLRTGPAFVEPDGIVMNPTTWSKLRRTKDANHRPLYNVDPTAAESNSLYGVPVLVTTSCPVGTALVASFQQGAVAFVRRGITLEVSNSQGTNFVNNQTSIRCEERITIGCPRPAALCKVINL